MSRNVTKNLTFFVKLCRIRRISHSRSLFFDTKHTWARLEAKLESLVYCPRVADELGVKFQLMLQPLLSQKKSLLIEGESVNVH